MDAVERKRNRNMPDATDASDDLPATRAKRCRVDDLLLASAAEEEVAEEHAKLWGPEIKAHSDATHASLLEGVDAVISAWAADQCNKALRQELSAYGGESHWNAGRTAKDRDIAAWEKFKGFKPFSGGALSRATADTRRVHSWKMLEGREGV